MEPTQEEISRWKASEITKKVFSHVSFGIEELKEALVSGVQNPEFTRGFIQGARFVMQIGEGDESDGNR